MSAHLIEHDHGPGPASDLSPLSAMRMAATAEAHDPVSEETAGVRVTETGVKIVAPMRIHRYHRG